MVIETLMVPMDVNSEGVFIFRRFVANGAPDRAARSVDVSDVDAKTPSAREKFPTMGARQTRGRYSTAWKKTKGLL